MNNNTAYIAIIAVSVAIGSLVSGTLLGLRDTKFKEKLSILEVNQSNTEKYVEQLNRITGVTKTNPMDIIVGEHTMVLRHIIEQLKQQQNAILNIHTNTINLSTRDEAIVSALRNNLGTRNNTNKFLPLHKH